MSINDLDLILKKDPIIATWKAKDLCKCPEDVEKDYLVHARTHLSLGNTAKYVDIIFKWVGGQNQGAFIGAVLGDYGEGKTSFLVHVWQQSSQHNILSVPPFEWTSFDQILDAVSEWIQYKLQPMHPDLARKVQRIYEKCKIKTIEELAKAEALKKGKDFQTVLKALQDALETGRLKLTALEAPDLLDFIKEISEIVPEAGYKGVLVLLDEPEVAAKELGVDTVQHFIFDLSNELHRRQGNYGFFLSMPANFYANAATRFSALTARLEIRNCFPRLGDIYSNNFAEVLWERYSKEFELGEYSQRIVSPLALSAIGQACSSERKDLSYGPRSVISAFRRMVDRYKETDQPYESQDFVDDVLDGEILVKPEYRTRILAVMNSQDKSEENFDALKFLSAFPSGVKKDVLKQLGMDEILMPLARSDGLVYRTAFTMGLRELRKLSTGPSESNQLRDIIEEIDSEYAPGLAIFQNAVRAFASDVLPMIIKERSGQQLDGWTPLKAMGEVSPGLWFGTIIGAFPQTSKTYPQRAAMALVSSIDDKSIKNIHIPKLDKETGPQHYDFVFHFALRWHADQKAPENTILITESESFLTRIYLDLFENKVQQDHIAEMVGADRMTPLWTLNLIHRMKSVNLNKEYEGEWKSLLDMLKRQLLAIFLGENFSNALAKALLDKMGEQITGSGPALLDKACNAFLKKRYPTYNTLIRRPQWQSKIDTYINVLSNSKIPLACKRGRQVWKPMADDAAAIFNTSRMNLTGGAFEGFEELIEITSSGKQAALEIRFKIHPLEQEIRELLSNSTIQITKDKVQCNYLPITEILPAILDKGYTVEELHGIIRIGAARNSFEETQQGAERGLFARPLDIEELKAQLRDKLKELNVELLEFRKIPEFHNPFDPTIIEDQVEKIQDESDYDTVRISITSGFTSLHTRLEDYFKLLSERLDNLHNGAETISKQLLESREVTQFRLPDAKSTWRDALQRFIFVSIQQEIENFRKASKSLLTELGESSAAHRYGSSRSAQENLQVLIDGWSKPSPLEQRKNELGHDAQQTIRHLNDFANWIQTLRKSDQVYENILGLATNSAHKVKHQELLAKFDAFSSSVIDHLATKNINGLASYNQYQASLDDLEKEGNQYLADLKSTYDQYKDRLNRLLEKLNIGERLKLPFNPLAVAEQYMELRNLGVALIRQYIFSQAEGEIETLDRELSYARDILKSILGDDAKQQAELLSSCKSTIENFQTLVTSDWLDQVAAGQDDDALQHFESEAKSVFTNIRSVRQKIQEITQPAKTITDQSASTLYQSIPEQGQMDLKQLILINISKTNDATEALDSSLAGLVELFRQNLIQIRVERRKR
jgi:hypothetical protein